MNETRHRQERSAPTGPSSEARRVPAAGEYVGERYRLDELLGTGGFAQVWRATPVDQPPLDDAGPADAVVTAREGTTADDAARPDERATPEAVAVKLLHPYLVPDGTPKLRLIGEARTVRELHHPNIVQLLDVVLNEAEVALVFEYVGGGSLAAEIGRRRRLDPRRAAWIASQIADALEYAHRRDVVHRDVTPRNILLGADGTPKLADFGIARLLEESATTATLTGTVLGTLRYMAPEQLAGHEVDSRADVYSLGIVLYEMLAGRPPYDARTPIALVEQQRNGPPSPPGDGSPALAAIAMACIRRSPKDRPRTAGQVRDALNQWLATGHLAPGSLAPGSLAPGSLAPARAVSGASVRALGGVGLRGAATGAGTVGHAASPAGGGVAGGEAPGRGGARPAAGSRGVVPGVAPPIRSGAARRGTARSTGLLVALLPLGGALFAGFSAFAGLPSGQRVERVGGAGASLPIAAAASSSPAVEPTVTAAATPNAETPEPGVVAVPTPVESPTAAPTQQPAPARFSQPTPRPTVVPPIQPVPRPGPPHHRHRH